MGSHFLTNSRPCRDVTRLLITPDLSTLWRESVSNAPSCGAWEGAFLRAPSGGALRLLPFRGPRGVAYSPLPRAAPPHLLHQGPWGGDLQPPPSRSTPGPLAKHPRSIPKRSGGRAEGASPSPDRGVSRSPSAGSGQAPRRESGAGAVLFTSLSFRGPWGGRLTAPSPQAPRPPSPLP